jgi:hypothetical protein
MVRQLRAALRGLKFGTVSVVLLGLVYVGINLTDDKLQPEPAAVLKRSYSVPQEATRGYQTLEKMSWYLPDPIEQYAPEITGTYLKAPDYESVAEQIPGLMEKHAKLLKTYDLLLSIGTSGRDIQAIKDTSKLSKSLEFALLFAWRLKALQINQLLRGKSKNREQIALAQMQRIFAFHLKSLKYPAFLFTTMTHVSILRAIHVFVNDAAEDMPSFAKVMTPQVKKGFEIDRDPKDLLEDSLIWELAWVDRTTKESPAYDEFMNSIIANPVTVPQRLSKFVLNGPMHFNKRRLLNAIYSCWKDDGRIPFKYQLFFPAVWQLTNTLCAQSSGRLVKLTKELGELRSTPPKP